MYFNHLYEKCGDSNTYNNELKMFKLVKPMCYALTEE